MSDIGDIGPPARERGRVSQGYVGRYQVALVMMHVARFMALPPKDVAHLGWLVSWYVTGNIYDNRQPEGPVDQQTMDAILKPLSDQGKRAAMTLFTHEREGWVIRWPMPGFARRPTIPKATRQFVLDRDGHRCVWCGATEQLEMDHVDPYCHGGPDDAVNLQTLCKPCNLRKGARKGRKR